MAVWSWKDAFRLWKEVPSVNVVAEQLRQSGRLDEDKYRKYRKITKRTHIIILTLLLLCLVFFLFSAGIMRLSFFILLVAMSIWFVRNALINDKAEFFLLNTGESEPVTVVKKSESKKWLLRPEPYQLFEFSLFGRKSYVEDILLATDKERKFPLYVRYSSIIPDCYMLEIEHYKHICVVKQEEGNSNVCVPRQAQLDS